MKRSTTLFAMNNAVIATQNSVIEAAMELSALDKGLEHAHEADGVSEDEMRDAYDEAYDKLIELCEVLSQMRKM